MALRDARIASTAATILGLAAVAAGAYLPWVRPNPALVGEGDAIPDILLPKMNAGFEAYSLLLAVAVLAVLGVLVRGRRDRFQSATVFLAGAGTIALLTYYLYSSSPVGFDATFVPSSGWYLTLGGGFLLSSVGVFQRWRTVPSNGRAANTAN